MASAIKRGIGNLTDAKLIVSWINVTQNDENRRVSDQVRRSKVFRSPTEGHHTMHFSGLRSPHDIDSTTKLQPSHALNSAGPSTANLPPRELPDIHVSLPHLNTRPHSRASEELSPYNALPEFKKEGTDWFALFNPKAKRNLDINLVHSFTHPR